MLLIGETHYIKEKFSHYNEILLSVDSLGGKYNNAALFVEMGPSLDYALRRKYAEGDSTFVRRYFEHVYSVIDYELSAHWLKFEKLLDDCINHYSGKTIHFEIHSVDIERFYRMVAFVLKDMLIQNQCKAHKTLEKLDSILNAKSYPTTEDRRQQLLSIANSIKCKLKPEDQVFLTRLKKALLPFYNKSNPRDQLMADQITSLINDSTFYFGIFGAGHTLPEVEHCTLNDNCEKLFCPDARSKGRYPMLYHLEQLPNLYIYKVFILCHYWGKPTANKKWWVVKKNSWENEEDRAFLEKVIPEFGYFRGFTATYPELANLAKYADYLIYYYISDYE